MRDEPPPKTKRRPCRGGALNFDPASIETVSMNGWIIRLRKAPHKAAQAPSYRDGRSLSILMRQTLLAHACFQVPTYVTCKIDYCQRLRGEWGDHE
jgi:hypothetical protein